MDKSLHFINISANIICLLNMLETEQFTCISDICACQLHNLSSFCALLLLYFVYCFSFFLCFSHLNSIVRGWGHSEMTLLCWQDDRDPFGISRGYTTAWGTYYTSNCMLSRWLGHSSSIPLWVASSLLSFSLSFLSLILSQNWKPISSLLHTDPFFFSFFSLLILPTHHQ